MMTKMKREFVCAVLY